MRVSPVSEVDAYRDPTGDVNALCHKFDTLRASDLGHSTPTPPGGWSNIVHLYHTVNGWIFQRKSTCPEDSFHANLMLTINGM